MQTSNKYTHSWETKLSKKTDSKMTLILKLEERILKLLNICRVILNWRKRMGPKKIKIWIMVENFSNLVKNINLKIEETQKSHKE